MILLLTGPSLLPSRQKSIDDLFDRFADQWVRLDPNLAREVRYFKGGEQDALEQQLTPDTLAWKRNRIQLARKGLKELDKFRNVKMVEIQRVSAEVMRWQLQAIVDEEPCLDYIFPLNQFVGAKGLQDELRGDDAFGGGGAVRLGGRLVQSACKGATLRLIAGYA